MQTLAKGVEKCKGQHKIKSVSQNNLNYKCLNSNLFEISTPQPFINSISDNI